MRILISKLKYKSQLTEPAVEPFHFCVEITSRSHRRSNYFRWYVYKHSLNSCVCSNQLLQHRHKASQPFSQAPPIYLSIYLTLFSLSICIYIYIYVYIYIYIYMCLCMYVCIYIYISIHTCIHTILIEIIVSPLRNYLYYTIGFSRSYIFLCIPTAVCL